MSEINPITSTSCEKMTGTRVHHVEHSKKSRDPSFEHLRIYDRNSPIKKHIPNTLVGVHELACFRNSAKFTNVLFKGRYFRWQKTLIDVNDRITDVIQAALVQDLGR